MSGRSPSRRGPKFGETLTSAPAWSGEKTAHAARNPAFDHLIGGVDRREPGRGDRDELLRHAARDQPVGMVVGDQLAVAPPHLVERQSALDAEHDIGIGVAEIDVAGQDALVVRLVDLEDLGDAVQEIALALMQHAVGLGDVEQPVEDILQHRAVLAARAAQPRHPLGIGLEAGDVLLGEVVEPRDVARLVGRHREDLLEGADLVLRDDAVGLRHLGRKRDHGDREGDLAAQLRIAGEERCARPRRRPATPKPDGDARETNSPRRNQIDMAVL